MFFFIKALWGIGHEEEALAPTEVVMTPRFPLATLPPSYFLLPGIGTVTQSLENYLG